MLRLSLPGTAAILLAACLTASPCAAQDSRAEVIAQEQAAKVERLAPEEASSAERLIVRTMSSAIFAVTDGVHPWFGSIYPGAGFSGGVGYIARYPRHAQLSLLGAVSVKGSTQLQASFSGPRLLRDTVTPRVSAAYTRVRKLSYFGLGQGSSRDDRTPFDYSPATAGGGLTFEPAGWLTLDADYAWRAFDTGGSPDLGSPLLDAPAFARNLRYHVVSAAAIVDSRPSPSYSTRGSMLRGEIARHVEPTGAPYDFTQTEIEAVQLVPILREQFVLAFRGLATFSDVEGDDEVPFVLLPYVGSGNTIRGLANRRFADRNRLVLTGEYRWRPSRVLDMAVFLDAGQVGRERDDLAARRLTTSWGIGARFHGPRANVLRLDLARSREGLTLVVATGQPF